MLKGTTRVHEFTSAIEGRRPLIQLRLLLMGIFTIAAVAFAQPQPMDINLENYQYPYPVKFLTVENQRQSLRMAYMDSIPSPSNGRAVLLLHGRNFNGAYWKQTADTLLNEGYRVIIPDQIGFGKSSKPEHFQYSFQQLATNTKGLLDSLGVRNVTVVGHSMGGMLATRFALMFPEVASQLVLVNPIGLEDYKTMIPYQTIDELYQKELKQNYESLKGYQMSSYYDNRWEPEYEQWLAPLAGWTLSPNYPLISWNNALTTDMVITQPVVYEFDQLKCSTLLIIGQRDRTAVGKDAVPKPQRDKMGNYPELGKKTKDKIPHCELVEIKNIGHLPHIESFSEFIKPLIKFLDK